MKGRRSVNSLGPLRTLISSPSPLHIYFLAEMSTYNTPSRFNITEGFFIPDSCTPTTYFLEVLSALSNSCVPTPLAFLSTLLGCFSIVAWLFAQLPQIYKNHQLKSTSGLSAFFLVEWCLGDLSNLFGAILTRQASWQVIIGAYYCFVDFMLVGQWIWFEHLKHGRPLKKIWLRRKQNPRGHSGDTGDRRDLQPDPQPFILEDEISVTDRQSPRLINSADTSVPQDIPTSKAGGSANSTFNTPVYGTISPSSRSALTSRPVTPALRMEATSQSASRNARPSREMSSSGLNPLRGSPKAVFFTSTILALSCLAVQNVDASPMATTEEHNSPVRNISLSAISWDLGTLLSWMSAFLYLVSRLPQLVLNMRRRSTSGLSLTLFMAAFSGNLFYSTSILTNPCLFESFGPYGGHGWAPPEGSDQNEWIQAALPFWLGAAGVLILDGSVGLQFWIYGDEPKGEREEVWVVSERVENGADSNLPSGSRRVRKWHMRRVQGYMRGWQPGVGNEEGNKGVITPVVMVNGRRLPRPDEQQPLLSQS